MEDLCEGPNGDGGETNKLNSTLLNSRGKCAFLKRTNWRTKSNWFASLRSEEVYCRHCRFKCFVRSENEAEERSELKCVDGRG